MKTDIQIDSNFKALGCYHDRSRVHVYTPKSYDQFSVDGFTVVAECMVCRKRVPVE